MDCSDCRGGALDVGVLDRNTKVPPEPCASSQLKSAVRALPT